jgi:hypothetical protein
MSNSATASASATATACSTCYSLLRVVCAHPENTKCPVRASFWCTQCACYGHSADECDDNDNDEDKGKSGYRPATLEELIPEEVRLRWNIKTETRIQFMPARSLTLDDKEREISPNNTIELPYKDANIRSYMKVNKIPTGHSMKSNILLLREWAVNNGMKIRLVSS